MKTKRAVLSTALAVMALGGAAVAASPVASAATTVSGYVTCVDQQNVEGVWIAASGGSGWASWSFSGTNYNAHFSRGGVSGSWTVHVGCGGSTSNWRYSPDGNTTTTSSYASWTCYTPDLGRPIDFCQHT